MAVRHVKFAERLTEACDAARVPPRNFGRLGWIRRELAGRFDQQVTVECVRKWLAGEAFPRPEKLKNLAALLEVEEGWLYSGASARVEEKAAPFDHAKPSGEATDQGQAFLDRIRQRFAGTVTIMPGVDLTDPTWEEVDEPHG